MRRSALLLLAVAATWAGDRPALGAECQRYEPELVRLDGNLQLKVFAGPPHYQSVETGDQPETVWLLTLAHPICIAAMPDDAWNLARDDVHTIQIVPRTAFPISLNGKSAQVQGTLYRAHGGHSHADIILRATRVTPAQ